MPLTRTRRRILIATLVVVGILFAWWALLPPVDQRFVGKWLDNSGTTFTLRDNGWGTMGPYTLRWWMDKGQYCSEVWSSDLSENYEHITTMAKAGREFAVTRLDVIEATPDLMRLRQQNGHVQTWKRLTD
jgi:hypothetical protein